MRDLEQLNLQRQKIEGWLPGTEGRRKGELLFNWHRVLVLQDNEDSGDGWWIVQQYECTQNH